MKKRIKDLLLVFGGCFLCALAFNVFFSPYHIMPGGVSGIAIILNYLFNLEYALSILLLSIMFLLISFIFFGKKSTLKSINGSLLLPTFVYFTGLILSNFDLKIDNMLLASVFGGLVFGFGIGLVYKAGYTTGGSEILSKILNKYAHISLGTSTLIVDGIISTLGIFIFGLEVFIYSIISVYIASIVINKVLLGIFGNKSFYIITSHPNEIKEFIIKELGHGATIIDGKGAYSNKNKSIILAVIPTSDYYKLKDGLASIDNDAFFTVCESYEVGGGK